MYKFFSILSIAFLAGCTTVKEKVTYVPIKNSCPTFPIKEYPALNTELEFTVKKVGDNVQISKDAFLQLIKNYKEYKKYYNSLYTNVKTFNDKVNEMNMEE